MIKTSVLQPERAQKGVLCESSWAVHFEKYGVSGMADRPVGAEKRVFASFPGFCQQGNRGRKFCSSVVQVFFKEGDLRCLSCRESGKKTQKIVNRAGIFLIFPCFFAVTCYFYRLSMWVVESMQFYVFR